MRKQGWLPTLADIIVEIKSLIDPEMTELGIKYKGADIMGQQELWGILSNDWTILIFG